VNYNSTLQARKNQFIANERVINLYSWENRIFFLGYFIHAFSKHLLCAY